MSDRICDFTDCGRRHRAKGLCHAHYQQSLKGQALTRLIPRTPISRAEGEAGCSVPGCVRRHDARGFCKAHYKAWKRGRVPMADRDGGSVSSFFRSVIDVGDCWKWLGSTDSSGYGRFRSAPAHRWSFEYLRDEIPDGLTMDHLCRNRWCVNPWHLEPVPNRENILRGISPTALNARKTHCHRGHEFSAANTHISPTTGWRTCKSCRRDRRLK